MTKRMNQDNHWLKVFDNFKQSGLTQRKFCIQHDYSYAQFKYYWEKLVQKPKQNNKTELNSFAPISITPSSASSKAVNKDKPIEMVIDLPNKIRCSISIDGASTQLTQLMKQLVSIC